MEHIDRLTQLNVELEGLLHVLAKRDNDDLRKLLGSKFEEFSTLFRQLLDEGETSGDAVEDSIAAIDNVLAADEVKDQEAVSDEVEEEMDAAVDAIEHGEQHEEAVEADEIDEDSEVKPLGTQACESLFDVIDQPDAAPEVAEQTEEEEKEDPIAEELDMPGETGLTDEFGTFHPLDQAMLDEIETIDVTLDEPEDEEPVNAPEPPLVEEPAAENHIEEQSFEAPIVDAPVVDAPAEEVPAEDVPAEPAPAVEAPAVEEPVAESPVVETPRVAPSPIAPAAENDDIRVDEMLTRRGANDLKKVFTLNDKFRFRRELFNQDDDLFRATLETLNEMPDYNSAKTYLLSLPGWSEDNDTVQDFLSTIKPHYV